MADNLPQRVLVLTGPNGPTSAVIERLGEAHELVMAGTIDQALEALRSQEFAGVFSETGNFLPLERAMLAVQSGVILNTIGEAVCITDGHGMILWRNRRMSQWAPEITERVSGVCKEAFAIFASQVSPPSPEVDLPPDALPNRSKKFTFNIDNHQFFELVCSPVFNDQMRVTQIVSICWDATSGRRLQQKIDAIDQAGRELMRLEGDAIAKLDLASRLKLLEEKIITYCRQLMNFDHFAIRLLDRKTNRLEPVICVGLPREAMDIALYCLPEGNGISGYVCATGRSYICNDVHRDPRYVTGLGGARSTLTVPLMLHDKTIGVFNIESRLLAGFSEDDRQFAEIFGRYVAVALNILDLLVVERYTASGQLARDVSSEISGPVNDIISDAGRLLDEFIGNDAMRAKLGAIVDNANKISASVKQAAAGRSSIFGAGAAPEKKDLFLEGKRLLVADDEPNIRQTLSDILTRYGCEVTLARDGAEACLALETTGAFDLVISDIKMPHRTGYEIFAIAAARPKPIPVILMTGFGYDPNHSIVRARQEGLAAVIFKPFKVEQLLTELRKALTVAAPA